MRQSSTRFPAAGTLKQSLAFMAALIAAGCYGGAPNAELPIQEYPPAPQSPFECHAKGGWQSATPTTDVRVDFCSEHSFQEIPKLAERVSASQSTMTIIEIDTSGATCSSMLIWATDITGSTINIQLYAKTVTGAICLHEFRPEPYMLRFRVPISGEGVYQIRVDDEIHDEHEEVTISVPAKEIEIAF